MKPNTVPTSFSACKNSKNGFITITAQHEKILSILYSQYRSSFDSKDDFLSESYITILECLQDYDPNRGLDLNVYIYTKLKWRMYSISRQNRSRNSRFIVTDEVPESHHIDNYRDLEDKSIIKIYDYMLYLHPRQKMALVYRYLYDQPYEKIALHMNVKEATVRSLVRHGLNRLRSLLPVDFSSDA